jgi:hypothetical protein
VKNDQLTLATAEDAAALAAKHARRMHSVCIHCCTAPADDEETCFDVHQHVRRASLLPALDARLGNGEDGLTTHHVAEQAAHRFFELAALAQEGLRGRFTDAEWLVLLSCEPSPAWYWDRWTTVATMVADDLGIEALDELDPDSELRALLVKLGDLTPLENATLVDACERVWRGLENPLR